jgi:ribonuclease E
VRVAVVTEDTAWAELLTPVEPVEEPLTAEAEAEKPTRSKRPSSLKKDDGAEVVDGDAEELDDEYEEDEVEDAVAEEPAEGETPADGDAPGTPKKRTRRGSRGGRNRKKKTATATGTGGAIAAASTNGGEVQEVPDTAASEAPVETEEPEQADEPAGPVIHVPGRDLGSEDGDTSAPVKKKTRRGSRGGKNRKKKTAAATGVGVALATADEAAELEPEETAAVAVEEAPVEEAAAPEAPVEEPVAEEPDPEPKPEEPSQNGDGDWGYTPMSQWGIDE